MTLTLRPQRGGFLKAFGCGTFIRDFLMGLGPSDSAQIDPIVGAPQADVCYEYKMALLRATAMNRATQKEERDARRQKRTIDPRRIDRLYERSLLHYRYKSSGARYSSFVRYFAMIQKLGWVEPTGKEEPSAFQANSPLAQPRRYFRLTPTGRKASDSQWANPRIVLYPSKPK